MVEASIGRVLEFARSDAAAGRLARWGLSTVIDEHAGEAAVGPELFRDLHSAAGIDAHFPVGNAGLIRLCGHRFSETPTPFGLKREGGFDGVRAAALSVLAGSLRD